MPLIVMPLRWYERFGDWLMAPMMRLVSGAPCEEPQRTHRWNNTKVQRSDVAYMASFGMVHSPPTTASERVWYGIPLFHLPIFGGWKRYIVLEPVSHGTIWYVGWITRDVVGFSRVPLCGLARVLIGPDYVAHFGLDGVGNQVSLRKVAEGSIGDRGPFAQTLFL